MSGEAIDRRVAQKETETPVSGLLINAYDVALRTIAPKYRMGPHDDLYLFHTIQHPTELGGGDGHINNVGKMVRLYEAAVADAMIEHGEDYPPTPQSDPLEYHRRLDGYFRKYGNLAGLWDQFSSEQKQRIAERLLQIDADGHDISNTVLHIEWEPVRDGEEALVDAVIPQAVLRYEGSEPQAADMVTGYLRTFRQELELSKEELILMQAASTVMIKRTKIRPNGFLFPGEPSDAALVALSEFDQLSAVFDDGVIAGGIGLAREYGTRIETEGMPQKTINPYRFMSDWFLPDRFRKLQQEGSPSMEEFVGFLDRFRKKSDESLTQFVQIMEVKSDKLQEVPDLVALAKERLKMQSEVIRLLWRKNREIPTSEIFSEWTPAEFDLARQACQLSTQHYWDVSYTTKEFLRDLNQ